MELPNIKWIISVMFLSTTNMLFALALQLCAVACIWVLCRTKQNSNNNRYQ